MEEKLIYRTVAITERLPKVANENYLTISKNGIETARFFNGTRFETAHYEGDIFFWLDSVDIKYVWFFFKIELKFFTFFVELFFITVIDDANFFLGETV